MKGILKHIFNNNNNPLLSVYNRTFITKIIFVGFKLGVKLWTLKMLLDAYKIDSRNIIIYWQIMSI